MGNAFESIKFTGENRYQLYQRLGSLIESGRRPSDVIMFMIREYKRRGVRNSERAMLESIANRLEANDGSIADALDGLVPTNEKLIIDSGIKKHREAEAFKVAAGLVQKMMQIKKAVKSKLTYPVILYGITLVLFVGGYKMLDTFSEFVPIHSWDSHARMFYDTGKYLFENGLFLVLMAAAFVIGVGALMVKVPATARESKTYQRIRNVIDKVPPFSIYKKVAAVSFLTALGGQLRAGATPKESLLIMWESAPDFLKMHISTMLRYFDKQNVGVAITSTKLMSVEQEMSIRLIAETKDFSEAIQQTAEKTMEQVDKDIARSTTFVMLGGWIAAGGTVAWAALSQFSVILGAN